jgi:hypothetical protein
MSMFDGVRYTCISCGIVHNKGMYDRSFNRPLKCKECNGWICPSCQNTESKTSGKRCPKCNGELFTPQINTRE